MPYKNYFQVEKKAKNELIVLNCNLLSTEIQFFIFKI